MWRWAPGKLLLQPGDLQDVEEEEEEKKEEEWGREVWKGWEGIKGLK